MQLIFTHENIAQVGLVQSYLAEHNIASQMRNQHASSVMGEVAFFSVWPECWVADADAAAALAILQTLEATPTNTQEWSCAECGETSPANFAVCWNCQAPQSND